MRENRTCGSEGGEAQSLPYPYPIPADYKSAAPVLLLESELSSPPEFVLFLALNELAEGGEGGGDVVAEPGGGGALRLAAEDAEVAVGVADADG